MKILPPAFLALCTTALFSLLYAQSHRVVEVSDGDVRQPCEVSVAINPRNPDNIVVVGLAKPAAGKPRVTNYTFVTTDGGKNWTTAPAPNPDMRVQGDDAVTFSDDGTAFRSYIAFWGLRAKQPKRVRNGIFIMTSSDAGHAWREPVPVVDHLNTMMPFEDKPYIVTDNMPASPFKNHVYVSWTRFDRYGSDDPADSTQIFFSRSVDGARTFAPPIRISDHGGDCIDGDNTVEGAVPAVGVNGEVFVVWSGPLGLVFDVSTDGGVTFGRDRIIAPHPGGWDIDITGLGRCNGMPVTGVDHSDGAYRGTLYVNWVDDRHGDPDVWVMFSRNAGQTWSQPVRVNDDAVGNGKEQFFTWMAVDPIDGAVNIIFFDRRNLDGTQTAVTLARSIDGGQTFANFEIALPPFASNPRTFFGDYIGIDAYAGTVVPAFPHFVAAEKLAVSVALFRFRAGTNTLLKN